MTAFHAANAVLEQLERAGFQAYLVGGCVRDFLLRQEPTDYDVATDATPQQVQGLFPHTVATGIAHGTVTVLSKEAPIEVTTFRVETAYSDGRRPDQVRFVSRLEEDLARRDFTINAMAQDRRGQIYDPFNGRKDLAQKRIRAVGDPEQRFSEDALRIVRGIRFAAQLGFSIDSATEQAMIQLRDRCVSLSVERVVQEIEKIWASPRPARGCKLLWSLGIIAYLPPFYRWGSLPQPDDPQFAGLEHASSRIIRWALLLYLCGVSFPDTKEKLQDLRLSSRDTTEIAVLYCMAGRWSHTLAPAKGKRIILKEGWERTRAAVELAAWMGRISLEEATQQQKRFDIWRDEMPVRQLKELAIDGKSLVDAAGKRAGPWVGQALQALLEQTALGYLPNQREILLKEGSRFANNS